MPLPFAALGAIVSVLTSTTAFTVVSTAAAAYTVKKIYDAATEDSGSSRSTSGPSREEVREKERVALFREFEGDIQKFWLNEPNLLCADGKDSLNSCLSLYNAVEQGSRTAASAMGERKSHTCDKHEALGKKLSWGDTAGLIKTGDSASVNITNAKVLVASLNRLLPEREPHALLKENYEAPERWRSLKELEDVLGGSDTFSHDRPRVCSDNGELSKLWLRGVENTKALSEGKEPRIVVCGLLKAGKSSLLNMLTGNLEEEIFKTAAKQETRHNKKFSHKGLCYIDTPGLDAPNEGGKRDEKEAWAAYLAADTLLFVHAAERELTQKECDVLVRLRDERANFAERTLLVLTWKDEHRNEEHLERLISSISKQVQNAVGVSLPIIAVSNKYYKKGVLEKKNVLKKESGMGGLQAILREHCKKLNDVAEERREQIKWAKEGLRDWLIEEKKKVKKTFDQEKESRGKMVKDFKANILEPARNRLADIG